jgi:hypothetical protein
MTKEDYKNMIHDADIYIMIKQEFLDFYAPGALVFKTKYYNYSMKFIYITQAIVWGYMSFGIGISYLIRFFI